jgi:selenocysteine lyase/cysteine desulfurase
VRFDRYTLIEAIDESTSVVAVSSVQYATGTIVDISRLRQSTVQVGAHLIVDAAQAAGAVRVDAMAWDADPGQARDAADGARVLLQLIVLRPAQ